MPANSLRVIDSFVLEALASAALQEPPVYASAASLSSRVPFSKRAVRGSLVKLRNSGFVHRRIRKLDAIYSDGYIRGFWGLSASGVQVAVEVFGYRVSGLEGKLLECPEYFREALGDRSDSPATHTPPESASQ